MCLLTKNKRNKDTELHCAHSKINNTKWENKPWKKKCRIAQYFFQGLVENVFFSGNLHTKPVAPSFLFNA